MAVFSRLLRTFVTAHHTSHNYDGCTTVDYQGSFPHPTKTGTQTLRLENPALSSYLLSSEFSRIKCPLDDLSISCHALVPFGVSTSGKAG